MGQPGTPPPVDTWTSMIDTYTNTTADGGYDVATCVWPGWETVFSPHFPDLAQLLRERRIPAVDFGGFVPGGTNDFDVTRSVPSESFLDAGRSVLNPPNNLSNSLFMGMDMGEQDVRYLWGYAKTMTTSASPDDRFTQYKAFRDFSWEIERQSGSTMASLSATTYGSHYWHKTGQVRIIDASIELNHGVSHGHSTCGWSCSTRLPVRRLANQTEMLSSSTPSFEDLRNSTDNYGTGRSLSSTGNLPFSTRPCILD